MFLLYAVLCCEAAPLFHMYIYKLSIETIGHTGEVLARTIIESVALHSLHYHSVDQLGLREGGRVVCQFPVGKCCY